MSEIGKLADTKHKGRIFMNSKFQYEDILDMEYPNPEIEKAFPDKVLRAAQFAPFAALTGYGDAVSETAKRVDSETDAVEEADDDKDFYC